MKYIESYINYNENIKSDPNDNLDILREVHDFFVDLEEEYNIHTDYNFIERKISGPAKIGKVYHEKTYQSTIYDINWDTIESWLSTDEYDKNEIKIFGEKNKFDTKECLEFSKALNQKIESLPNIVQIEDVDVEIRMSNNQWAEDGKPFFLDDFIFYLEEEIKEEIAQDSIPHFNFSIIIYNPCQS
jgi:hypothetical protein